MDIFTNCAPKPVTNKFGIDNNILKANLLRVKPCFKYEHDLI